MYTHCGINWGSHDQEYCTKISTRYIVKRTHFIANYLSIRTLVARRLQKNTPLPHYTHNVVRSLKFIRTHT
jgi:hypothetical protein